MAFSFWENHFYKNSWDLLIVGAGFGGLGLAIEMAQRSPPLKVGILEAGSLSFGASTRNAGFCCYGSPSELLRDIRDKGEDTALATVAQRWTGIERIRSHFAPSSIGLEEKNGHELFIDPSSFTDAKANIERLNDLLKPYLGFSPYEELSAEEINSMGLRGILGGYRIHGEGMLDPFQLHRSLCEEVRNEGADLFFGTKVWGYEEKNGGVELMVDDQGTRLRTKKLVLACNGFTEDLVKYTSIKPGRGQVLITEALDHLALRGTFHLDKGNYYLRNVGNRLLLGGGRENAPEEESTTTTGLTDRIQDDLERLLMEHFLPDRSYRIEERWSGIMGFTEKGYPELRSIGDHSFLMAGFSGMGVALSFATREKMADLVFEALH